MTDFRVGFGYDSHRLEGGRKLYIGGIEIPHDKGCIAHSDGDILIHALCDALLGAAALRDIGTRFPDNDPLYKDIDSKTLLTETMKLIRKEGWIVHNADITLILEKPKISPYVGQIISTLAPLLHITENVISVKAKTNEKMGFIGKEEGIVAMAVVSLGR